MERVTTELHELRVAEYICSAALLNIHLLESVTEPHHHEWCQARKHVGHHKLGVVAVLQTCAKSVQPQMLHDPDSAAAMSLSVNSRKL